MLSKIKSNEAIQINLFKYGFSVIVTLLIGAILILAQGENPSVALREIINGAFGSFYKFGNTLRWTAPSLMLGIAAAVAFKAGVSNLGIEGQVVWGGFVAAIIGYTVELPPVLHITLCVVMAGFAGLLYVLVPALLRLFFNINEFITTLMLNFIAIILTEYAVDMIISGSGYTTATSTPNVSPSAIIPIIFPGTSVSAALPIAICLALFLYFVYKHTVTGYELKQVGENLKFAKAGGVPVIKSFLMIFLISGFISGACGGIEVLGTYKKFNVGFAANMGWDGIMVARIAESNPIAVIFVALIWGALRAGSLQMERVTNLNRFTVECMKMFFVLLVSINYEMLYYKIKYYLQGRKEKKEGSAHALGHS